MRYERKYRIEGQPAALVLREVYRHPARFRPQHAARQVNNVYFDTPDLLTFHQNVEGHSQRKKYRLRWYGTELKHISNARWEVKQKQAELGRKQVFNVGKYCFDTCEGASAKDLLTISGDEKLPAGTT